MSKTICLDLASPNPDVENSESIRLLSLFSLQSCYFMSMLSYWSLTIMLAKLPKCFKKAYILDDLGKILLVVVYFQKGMNFTMCKIL